MKQNCEKRRFKSDVRELTRPLNGQYPRPWMSKLDNPCLAEVFVVGKNQRTGYRTDEVSHERHVAALFNQEPGGCRRLYDEVRSGLPSPTRRNLDDLVGRLEDAGVEHVLETNVICYSTPMSADLRLRAHVGGDRRGEEIFRFLLSSIEPKALIVHGAGAVKKLGSILECDVPDPPIRVDDGLSLCRHGEMLIVAIRSLAPPEYNKWSSWAPGHVARVAQAVARHLHG